MSLSRLPLSILAATLLALVLGGCAGYQPGAAPPPPFRTLGIPPVEVQAYAPQSAALLHRALADAFVRGAGPVRLASPASSEAILEVKLSSYDRSLRTTRSDDTTLGRSFDLTIIATVTLRSADGSTVWLDGVEVAVTDPAYTSGDLPAGEYMLLPALAERLALRIRDRVLLHF